MPSLGTLQQRLCVCLQLDREQAVHTDVSLFVDNASLLFLKVNPMKAVQMNQTSLTPAPKNK